MLGEWGVGIMSVVGKYKSNGRGIYAKPFETISKEMTYPFLPKRMFGGRGM